MGIKTVGNLPGLPGAGTKKIQSYSPNRKILASEGVVVAFEDDDSQGWIGNFDDNHWQTSLPPFVFDQGAAFVFAGPYCYVVSGSQPDSCKIIESFNDFDPWVFYCWDAKEHGGYVVCVSKGGKIMSLNPQGDKIAGIGFGVCNDVKIEKAADGFLYGRYFEFNLDKWIDFKLSLPDLKED